MKDKIKKYLFLRDQQAELEGMLKAVKDEAKTLEEELKAAMDENGASQLSGENGEKLSLVNQRYLEIKDFTTFQTWLSDHGHGDVLKMGIDKGLANKLVFGMVDNAMPLPEGVEVGNTPSLRLYKGKAKTASLAEAIQEGEF